MYRMPPGPFGQMGPFSSFGPGPMPPYGGGFGPKPMGLLARLFTPSSGGSVNLLGMVENVQKVMKMADTVKPLVQQYGPMVKNLPSMLQLLKEYQNYSSDEDTKEPEKTVKKTKKTSKTPVQKAKPAPKKPVKKVEEVQFKKVEDVQSITTDHRQSIPKLYV
ncbi:YqfQ family protein [Pseudalkalibacillus decolorationis]|uniref:YqfQ family protein n=1 Tax=Pseudalkalibacillus decolorationis TaxID=163879 RepID=UPI002148A715|nr:YqfQ family protein [Pseudalkalibacillus decolorationis]